MTVAVGQVVDDDLDELTSACAGSSCHVCVQARDLGDGVEPDEGRDARDLGSLRSGSRVANLSNSSVDLASVVGTQEDLN